MRLLDPYIGKFEDVEIDHYFSFPNETKRLMKVSHDSYRSNGRVVTLGNTSMEVMVIPEPPVGYV